MGCRAVKRTRKIVLERAACGLLGASGSWCASARRRHLVSQYIFVKVAPLAIVLEYLARYEDAIGPSGIGLQRAHVCVCECEFGGRFLAGLLPNTRFLMYSGVVLERRRDWAAGARSTAHHLAHQVPDPPLKDNVNSLVIKGGPAPPKKGLCDE